MEKLVLVVGGAGYIGSHMVDMLLTGGYQPVVFDNLSTGHEELVHQKAIFVEGDLRNPLDVKRLFEKFHFHAVMHFAASSIVPESVNEPIRYYQNNVAAFLVLIHQMLISHVQRIIFSSTAAVYGDCDAMPVKEDSPLLPKNPYGRSKLMMEQILSDVAANHKISFIAFRYFNAAGAHASGKLGELHDPETHLIPNLLKAVLGEEKEFILFGDDYPTRDHTCVRDYIHVTDLCRAHLLGLEYLEKNQTCEIINLGSERGYSVMEMIKIVEKITGKAFRIKIGPRRAGDPAELIADSRKAKMMLNWWPKEDLESILRSASAWHEAHFNRKKHTEANLELIKNGKAND